MWHIFPSIVYIISAPASPVLGFVVDKTGRNVVWVMMAVVATLAAHMMLAFTFWNPWIAMVTKESRNMCCTLVNYCTVESGVKVSTFSQAIIYIV